MRTFVCVAALFAVCGSTTPAAAVPILLFESNLSVLYQCSGITCDADLPTGITDHIFFIETATLFGDIDYTPATVPFTTWADAGNDPDFSTMVGFMTNQVEDDWGTSFTAIPGGGGGYGGTDLTLFGTDFSGFVITRIGLEFNGMTINDTEAGWELFSDAHLLVEGEAVPEPSTLLLLTTGVGVGLATRARRRRTRASPPL